MTVIFLSTAFNAKILLADENEKIKKQKAMQLLHSQ